MQESSRPIAIGMLAGVAIACILTLINVYPDAFAGWRELIPGLLTLLAVGCIVSAALVWTWPRRGG